MNNTELTKDNWPVASDNAADYGYIVKVDGTVVGRIFQAEFTGPWITEATDGSRFESKTRKAAVERIAR